MLSTQEETAASEVPEDKEDFTNMSFDNGKSMQKKRILDKSYTAKLLSFAAAVCICFTGCARGADRYELRDEAVALYHARLIIKQLFYRNCSIIAVVGKCFNTNFVDCCKGSL